MALENVKGILDLLRKSLKRSSHLDILGGLISLPIARLQRSSKERFVPFTASCAALVL
jgi:hypothetical protein